MAVDKNNEQTTFSQEWLDKAVNFAHKHELFQRLSQLYGTIPEGECAGCAACCMESVETLWVEFLQIYDYLRRRPELVEELMPAIKQFYMVEGLEKRPCPFQLEGKRCAIYPARPLPCRLFGHWGAEDYTANFEVTREANQRTAEFYQKEYGITLPEDVVNYQVPYCHNFKKPRDITMDDFYDLLDGIMALQSRFLTEDLVDENLLTLGLVSWVLGAYNNLDSLSTEKLNSLK